MECHHELVRLPNQTRPIRRRQDCREGDLGQRTAEAVQRVVVFLTPADLAGFATATTGTFEQEVAAGDSTR